MLEIAHYRITAKIGEGGMGEVWRATDTKLHREVAVKILPDAFARDADRMARFQREAQVLASLNHPNIAAIYGVEERALVMELVEGPTLAERIKSGPMPLDEVLPLARQLAEALEYAHERGVVHRDLKPENLKVTRSGRVKVLDFGLAKAVSGDSASADEMAPTLTMSATATGAIMGTPAYMSPEQARGLDVDARTDIWAFGAVVCEMLTSRRLFAGPTTSDTLAAVLKAEPEITDVPPQIRAIVERCLRKDLRRRWQSIGDVRIALEEDLHAAVPHPTTAAPRSSAAWLAIAALLAIALAVAAAGWWRASRPVDHPLIRLPLDLGPDAIAGRNLTVAISPDGRRLVYPVRLPDGRQQLASRLLDQSQALPLPGTEDAFDPFFSPDGQSVGFFANGQLKRVPAQGGAPLVLCGAPLPIGADWADDGSIVAALNYLAPLFRVPAAGGTPQRLTRLVSGAISHRWPQVLPGAAAVLFTAPATTVAGGNTSIEAFSVKTADTKVVVRGGYHSRFVPGGYLLYVHQGVLFAVKFDPTTLQVSGTPVPIIEDLAANSTTGGGQFDLSSSGSGTLVYLSGKETAQTWQVAWFDSSGSAQPLISTPGQYYRPSLSPDGKKLAYDNGADLFVYDLERDSTTRLTFTGDATLPVWQPDSKHIVVRTTADQQATLQSIRADGSGTPQPLLEGSNQVAPWSISPDGRTLAYFEQFAETGNDILTVSIDASDPEHPKAGKPQPFVSTPADERVPVFSPDGRWIAYRSDESGSNEIYVRPFPPANGGKWQISVGDGGLYAFWSKNGRELYYETPDHHIMVVDYTVNGDTFARGKPRLWSDKQLFFPGTINLDVAPDGRRLLVLNMPESAGEPKGPVRVTMLLNFFDELKRRIP